MVAGRHFLPNAAPYDIGWKLAASNLSDLAAAGAIPHGAFLNLALPKACATDAWLALFSQGLFDALNQNNNSSSTSIACSLLGGDTTASPHLVLSMTVMGFVTPPFKPHTRSGAKVGDTIWVSGGVEAEASIGDAAAGLACLDKNHALHKKIIQNATVIARHKRPTPRLGLGNALLGIATACMDISDGIAGDLPHILRASEVSGALDLGALPSSHGFIAACVNLSFEEKLTLQFSGGDDYELLFTAAAHDTDKVLSAARNANVQVHAIGKITALQHSAKPVLEYLHHGKPYTYTAGGYQHFS